MKLKSRNIILVASLCLLMNGCGNSVDGYSSGTSTTEIKVTEQGTTEAVSTEEVSTEESTVVEVSTEEYSEVTDTITEQQALEAIKKYSYSKDPNLKSMEDSDEYTIYWYVSTNDNNEIVVLYRSYTAAEIRYYINPSSGETYVTEFVQGITDEEQKTEESLNVREYMD